MIWRFLLALTLSILVFVWLSPDRQRKPQPRQAAGGIPAGGIPAGGPKADGQVADRIGAAPALTSSEAPEISWGPDGRVESVAVRPKGGEGSPFLSRLPSGIAPLSISLRDTESPEIADWGTTPLDGWAVETADGLTTRKADFSGLNVGMLVSPAGAGWRGGHVVIKLWFQNSGDKARKIQYQLFGACGLTSDLEDGADLRFAYGVKSGGSVETRSVAASELDSEWTQPNIDWIGGTAARWLAALYAKPVGGQLVDFVESGVLISEDEGFASGLRSRSLSIEAGRTVEHQYEFYVGSRSAAKLAAYSRHRLADSNLVDVQLGEYFRCEIDTGSGSISRLYLRGIDRAPGNKDEHLDYTLLRKPLRGESSLSLELYELTMVDGAESDTAVGFSAAPWVIEPSPENSISMVATIGDFRVRKSIRVAEKKDDIYGAEVDGSPPHLEVSLTLENLGATERRAYYKFYGPCAIDSQSIRAPGYDLGFGLGYRGPRGDSESVSKDAGDIGQEGFDREGNVAWVGVANSYFCSALFPHVIGARQASFIRSGFCTSIPDPDQIASLAEEGGLRGDNLSDAAFLKFADKAFKNFRTGFRSVDLALPARSSFEHRYGLFAAERNGEIFSRYENLGLEGINNYGILGTIVSFFIMLLNSLKTLAFGSYGLGIILLTFCVKLCLHPLNKKSQRSIMRSQKKMQKVKPLMDALKKKYEGKDRMAMQREMQKLFREHGINPAQQLGGCLIIFLQLPIWIGLYRTLEYAIGLRQTSFLYIDDLTRPDGLFVFAAPVFGLLSQINLLPVLYVILTLVNQRLQPKPDDPQMQTQYKMMSFMMIFFGFIFYGFPSGFMLYIMTSAALGIVESKMIKAQLKREDDAEPTAPVAPAYPVKSSPPAGHDAVYPIKKKNKKRKR